jgi:hypothetical protein
MLIVAFTATITAGTPVRLIIKFTITITITLVESQVLGFRMSEVGRLWVELGVDVQRVTQVSDTRRL